MINREFFLERDRKFMQRGWFEFINEILVVLWVKISLDRNILELSESIELRLLWRFYYG